MQEVEELQKIRRSYSDYRSERALAVLHCSKGKKATHIAEMLGRAVQSVCSWLNAYLENGIEGLNRKYSPGRPSVRREKLQPCLEEYLTKYPRDYGWREELWSTAAMIAQFHKETGLKVSHDSVERALHDAGYSFKRARKGVPAKAPAKEEKLAAVKEIAARINELKAENDVEVMFLDESHFSTDPYVTRGWHKRGEPFFPEDTAKTGKLHYIWGIRTGKRFILLEEREQK
ncbi:MAG: IS630 family transposase [Lentisphaerae bacterium]|nr:IS630 family transposase [Lentisphaerota bacterium]